MHHKLKQNRGQKRPFKLQRDSLQPSIQKVEKRRGPPTHPPQLERLWRWNLNMSVYFFRFWFNFKTTWSISGSHNIDLSEWFISTCPLEPYLINLPLESRDKALKLCSMLLFLTPSFSFWRNKQDLSILSAFGSLYVLEFVFRFTAAELKAGPPNDQETCL
jgi:hypothetical protein